MNQEEFLKEADGVLTECMELFERFAGDADSELNRLALEGIVAIRWCMEVGSRDETRPDYKKELIDAALAVRECTRQLVEYQNRIKNRS